MVGSLYVTILGWPLHIQTSKVTAVVDLHYRTVNCCPWQRSVLSKFPSIPLFYFFLNKHALACNKPNNVFLRLFVLARVFSFSSFSLSLHFFFFLKPRHGLWARHSSCGCTHPSLWLQWPICAVVSCCLTECQSASGTSAALRFQICYLFQDTTVLDLVHRNALAHSVSQCGICFYVYQCRIIYNSFCYPCQPAVILDTFHINFLYRRVSFFIF